LNRAFLTAKANIETKNKNPEKYLVKVIKKYPDALKNQFVPNKEAYWGIENYDDFIKERSKIVSNEINKFLEKLVDTDEFKIGYDDMINEGESQNQEFKATFSYDIDNNRQDPGLRFNMIKTIAGFLNSDGGTLFVGVKDDGKIFGLENDYQFCFRNKNADGFELEFRSYLEKYFKDVVIRRYVEYKFEKIDNKDVLVVNVEKDNKRVFVKKENEKILYVRKGNKTEPMTDPEEIDEYIQEHWSEDEFVE
jgi:ribosomal protein S17E